jgi:hypothetical protein
MLQTQVSLLLCSCPYHPLLLLVLLLLVAVLLVLQPHQAAPAVDLQLKSTAAAALRSLEQLPALAGRMAARYPELACQQQHHQRQQRPALLLPSAAVQLSLMPGVDRAAPQEAAAAAAAGCCKGSLSCALLPLLLPLLQ